MSNEIQKASGVQPTVVQNAERSLYIENREGGIVNLNYNVPQASVTGEVLMAIQSFSRDYYQLIVTGHDIFANNTIVVTARCRRRSLMDIQYLRLLEQLIIHMKCLINTLQNHMHTDFDKTVPGLVLRRNVS